MHVTCDNHHCMFIPTRFNVCTGDSLVSPANKISYTLHIYICVHTRYRCEKITENNTFSRAGNSDKVIMVTNLVKKFRQKADIKMRVKNKSIFGRSVKVMIMMI